MSHLNFIIIIFIGDDIEERPNTVKIIPEEGCVIELSFPTRSDMFNWKRHLENAKTFKVKS